MLLYNGLKELGIPCSRPQAAFYLFPDIGEFGMDSFTFAELLLDKYGVATVPGVEFGKTERIISAFPTPHPLRTAKWACIALHSVSAI